MLDLVAVILCLVVLIYASYWDVRRRKVGNAPWLVLIAAGMGLAGYGVFNHGVSFLLQLLYSTLLSGVLSYIFLRLGLFGGADAKALISLSILFPVPPSFTVLSYQFPMLSSSAAPAFPLALTSLLYGAMLALTVPVSLFCFNLFRFGFKDVLKNLPVALIGYRVPVEDLSRHKHVRLVHRYEERQSRIEVRCSLAGGRISREVVERLKAYQRQSQLGTQVWVTPDLPFVLFLTCGFVAASLLGNFFLSWLI
jgi:preflagellin peptidase FlaK